MIRDSLTFDLGNKVASFGQNAGSYVTNSWYAPRNVFSELFWINDINSTSFPSNTIIETNYYNGVYIAEETIDRDKERLNIKKYDSTEDISGGFILQIDRVESDDIYCSTTSKQ